MGLSGRKTLHNEELRDFSYSPNIYHEIK